MPAGIETRHQNTCRSREGGRCNCEPGYRATVFDKRTGERRRKTFASAVTAKGWKRDAEDALRAGHRLDAGPTLADAFAEWLAAARTGGVRNRSGDAYKPSAIRAYEQNMRLRVLPAFGGVRLRELRAADLQRFVERLVGEGHNASTITTTILPLRAVYRRAFALGEVTVNPTRGLEMPAVRGRRERFAGPAEAEALLNALSGFDRALWATAMYAGLRRGELTALHREDVDLAAGVLRVRRGWDTKEGEIETKSRERRNVPIPAGLRDVLIEHVMGGSYSPEVRMFGGPNPVRASIDRADAVWKAAKLDRITLHECRHSYASLMIAAGVNAKALSTFMGHANISITLDRYGHLMPGSEEEAAGLLDAYLAADVVRRAQLTAPSTAPQALQTAQPPHTVQTYHI